MTGWRLRFAILPDALPDPFGRLIRARAAAAVAVRARARAGILADHGRGLVKAVDG